MVLKFFYLLFWACCFPFVVLLMVCSAILGILVSIAWLALSILLIIGGLASVVGFLVVGVIGLEMLKSLMESEFMFVTMGFRFAQEILDSYLNKWQDILYYNPWNFLY